MAAPYTHASGRRFAETGPQRQSIIGSMASARNHPKHHAVPRHVPKLARTRLLVALLIAVVVGLSVPRMLPALRLLLAWNAGTWALLAMAWSIILTADAARTKQRAAARDVRPNIGRDDNESASSSRCIATFGPVLCLQYDGHRPDAQRGIRLIERVILPSCQHIFRVWTFDCRR